MPLLRRPPLFEASTVAMVVLAAVLALTAASCKSEHEKFIDEGMSRLEDAIEILEEHKGDQAAAVKALNDYIKEHWLEIDRYQRRGQELYSKMSADEKAKQAEASSKRLLELRARIETLVRTYENPRELLNIIARFN